MSNPSPRRTIALVYQAGIANVFDITVQAKPRRLLQHAFTACEWYAAGLRDAGCLLYVYSCNQAGDITDAPWTRGLEECPFRDAANPPKELTEVAWYRDHVRQS